ncbi:Iron-sulfur cluster repair protein YtfE [Paenibacillus solanacearum]|uniref:Iron-sulfur cluster repair protein YtfE n=1 Tax=Paenibacillus solanacearum TaxID=2048548 RepID=A0A916K415_9BACL|nr:hemerythrin domain-containing protein [Paenibacillus solanacearum]CAG7641700.1 Iron-sulfur cluster repair protein YtfE [Paenibacillus solanacearum]
MEHTHHGCGAMGETGMRDIPLCAPLQQLKQEHIPLRKAMDRFHAAAAEIVAAADKDYRDAFAALRDQVAAFAIELEAHAWKEDDGLFPMMARYIGRAFGPIAVMEHEHRQAEQLLGTFLDSAGAAGDRIDQETAQELAGYAVQAYLVLTQHFDKEENVLFPMAERMLSPEEKDQLHGMMQELLN